MLIVDLEVENERADRLVAAAIEFYQFCFADRDGFHGVIRGGRTSGLIIGIDHVPIGIYMNIYGYFGIFIEIICERRETGDMSSR